MINYVLDSKHGLVQSRLDQTIKVYNYTCTNTKTHKYVHENTQIQIHNSHIYRNSSVSSKHVVDSKPGHVQSPRLDRAITPIIYFAHRQTTINHSSTLYLQAGKHQSLYAETCSTFSFSFMMKYLQHSIIIPLVFQIGSG